MIQNNDEKMVLVTVDVEVQILGLYESAPEREVMETYLDVVYVFNN